MTKPSPPTLTLRRHASPKPRPQPPATSSAPPSTGARELAPVVNSKTLLQGGTQLQIVHNGATYQLRATRLGKLILTK